MRSLARFTIRPSDGSYTRGDLILGAMFRSQDAELLKPNHVYEIRDVLGVLTIVDLGESAMGMYPAEATTTSPLKGMVPHVGWCSDVGHILSVARGAHLLARTEIGAHGEDRDDGPPRG